MADNYFTSCQTQLLQLAEQLQSKGLMLCSAESCTGGLVAAACTELAGSSLWFSHAIVSYSNQSKNQLLNVPLELIDEYGAVSEQVAQAMVTGLVTAPNLVGIAITGIAGPTGGSIEKPIGTVCFACLWQHRLIVRTQQFSGNRRQIRQASINYVFTLIQELLQ